MNTKLDLTGLEFRGKNANDYELEVFGDDLDLTADDAAFYCDGDGSRFVAAVLGDDRTIDIRCDGVMKVHDVVSECVYQNTSDLITAELRTDEELDEAERAGAIYFENNPWFDLYEDESGESLSIVTHTYSDALKAAFEVLLDIPTE